MPRDGTRQTISVNKAGRTQQTWPPSTQGRQAPMSVYLFITVACGEYSSQANTAMLMTITFSEQHPPRSASYKIDAFNADEMKKNKI